MHRLNGAAATSARFVQGQVVETTSGLHRAGILARRSTN